MKKSNKIIPFIILIIITASCKTFFIPDSDVEIPEQKRDSVCHFILDNQIKYSSLSIRFSATIESEENSDSFRGNLRILKDSAIWISVRSLNIEGARLLITPDSVKIINRLENTFYMGKINLLTERVGYDFSYYDLQALLTNSLFFFPNKESLCKRFNEMTECKSDIAEICYTTNNQSIITATDTIADGDDYALHKTEYLENIRQTIKLLPEIYRISELSFKSDLRLLELSVLYDKFFITDNQYFPKEIKITVQNPEFEINLDLSIDNLIIDREELSVPFSVPSRYKKIN